MTLNPQLNRFLVENECITNLVFRLVILAISHLFIDLRKY
jgi:hypothetical protein